MMYLLRLVSSVIENQTLSDEERELLRQKLTPFLRQFPRQTTANEALVEIYQRFDLWTKAEAWYLEKMASERFGSLHFYEAILKVGRQLDPNPRKRLHWAIEENPNSLIPLSLEYELDLLPDSRLRALVKNLELAFLPITQDIAFDPNIHLYNVSFRQERERFLTLRTLEDLQRRFQNQDPIVVKLITELRNHAQLPSVRVFYQMFFENEFRDMLARFPGFSDSLGDEEISRARDPLGIIERLQKSQENEAPGLRPQERITERDGNLLKVNFQGPGRARCVEIFVKTPSAN